MFDTPLNKKQEKNLYFFLLALTAAAAVFAVIVRCFHIVLTDEVPHCVFLAVTGFYCPGCGGSHAVDSFLSFHFLRSFLYHPAVLYFAVITGWYVLSHTAEYLSRGRLAIGMRYRAVWLYAAVAIILVNWIVRNILLKEFGILIY